MPIVNNVFTCPACGYKTNTVANLIPATAPTVDGVTPAPNACTCGFTPLTRVA